MFPAALAIVVQTFALRERGRALALFFGIAGGLTAIGPILGGYLTQWTWRAIFWVNIPVALIALILIVISKPATAHQPARMDYRGLVLIAAGVALSVFGFQQSIIWGWSNPRIGLCIAVGPGAARRVLLRRAAHRVAADARCSIFRIRPFLVENIVLGDHHAGVHPGVLLRQRVRPDLAGQVALAGRAVILLYFFIGFVDRRADRRADARPDRGQAPGRARLLLGAVGFYLWAGKVTDLSFSAQQWYIILAGAGMGFMLGPASTDAVNRASPALLRRGDRHHPDRPELRGQPRPGHPRHDPRLADAHPRYHLARSRLGRAGRRGRTPRRRASPQSQGGTAGAPRRSRTSSGSTSPRPRRPCST